MYMYILIQWRTWRYLWKLVFFIFLCVWVLSYSLKAAVRHFPVWRTWRSTYAATPERSPTYASIPAVSRPSATLVIAPNTSAHTWTRYVLPLLLLYQVKKHTHKKLHKKNALQTIIQWSSKDWEEKKINIKYWINVTFIQNKITT